MPGEDLSRRVTLAIGLFVLASGGGVQSAEPAQSAFDGLLRYRMPAGWHEDKSPLAAGPNTVEYWSDDAGKQLRIRIELIDGDPESNEAVSGLMKAPWDGAEQIPATEYDKTRVSGIPTTLWRRRSSPKYRMEPGAAIPYYLDEFCTVALRDRFLLFALSIWETRPFGDESAAERAWRSFLSSIELSKSAARGASPARDASRSAVWSVFNREGKEVLRIQDAPGPLYSTALPAPGAAPANHPFLSGTALDAAEEGRLRDILDHSSSFKDYVKNLEKSGYRVQSPR